MRSDRKRLIPITATLVIIFINYLANTAAASQVLLPQNERAYIPLVRRDPTPTPTMTPTPTPTPTLTPIPNAPSSPPPPSISYYVQSMDPAVSYNLGCLHGKRDLQMTGKQTSMVVLTYGYPQRKDGVYGAKTYSKPAVTFMPLSTIAESARNFGYGYWYCVGSDFDSHLTLVVGTSNYLGDRFPSVTYGHGQAWAQMVIDLNNWFTKTCARGCDGQVDVLGGTDMELAWSYPKEAIEWVNGYGSVSGRRDLVNFGALPGCPYGYTEKTDVKCGTWPYVWTRDEVLKVTSEPWIWSLAEIYLNSGINAKQWYYMSLYSYQKLGRPMKFAGSLTQYQACIQRWNSDTSCVYMDNTPREGWQQLYDLVEKDSRTRVGLFYSSDIKWSSEKDVVLPTSSQSLLDPVFSPKPAFYDVPTYTAPQPAPADYQPVIVEGSEGLVSSWEADITNLWDGAHQGRYMVVLAGAGANLPELAGLSDAQQGLVIVQVYDPVSGEFGMYQVQAPGATGALRVTGGADGRIDLQSESGERLVFDLATLTFLP